MYIKGNSPLDRLIIPVLNALSLIFKSLSFLNLKRKSFKQKRYPEAFIISIDNLSFGGTGKTTLVTEIGKHLEAKNIKFAVVTRGYKSTFESGGTKVQPHHSAGQVGDEAKIFKTRFPRQDIYVGKNRQVSIEKAIQDNNKIILLDDGFQTTDVYKDIKIMLVNPSHPYYYLRNFKGLMKTEDFVFFYKHSDDIKQTFPGDGGPFYGTYDFRLEHFCAADGKTLEIDREKTSLLGFSALGDNPRFKNDLSAFKLAAFRGYSDHYTYTGDELAALDKQRIEQQADYLVCTEKDFIKLKHLDLTHIPLIYVQNRIQFNIDLMDRILKYADEKNYL